MAVAQRGAISFGLVYIPVELYTATQEEEIRFNQLTKDSGERVKYVKTCASCKTPLEAKDIVKGYQYGKNKYVVVSDEDLEKIKTGKDRSIQILQFVELSAIPPVYFERAYQVVSQAGGEKPFELLRKAMQAEGKVAIGKTVLGTKETMLALVPTEDGILLQTLYYHDEIKDLPREVQHPDVSDQELSMAKQLIESMQGDFTPDAYHDEYQARLRDLIQKKIAGEEIVTPGNEPAPGNIVNLMDALKASLEQETKGRKKKTS